MPSLSIIIVNYRSWDILRKNLNALVSYHFQSFAQEIVVVDNCSDDGRFQDFVTLFPTVRFILNEGNWGFAHGCNLGAAIAKGDILLFLNPDTIAPKESIERMYLIYKDDAEMGILSCKQSEKPYSYQKILPSVFTLFGPQRSIYKLVFSQKFKRMNCQTCQTSYISPDWISGSVVMISRGWFEKAGGWNTDYWMYSEDVELSKRVKDLGGKLRLLCDVNIAHEHGGASRINVKTTALTKTEVIISQHVYIHNNFDGLEKALAHFLLVTNTLIFKGILGLLGILLWFIPKARVQFWILKNCLTYYRSAILNRTWLSPRSVKFPVNRNVSH
jgi:GT2 family glycosyltransferase